MKILKLWWIRSIIFQKFIVNNYVIKWNSRSYVVENIQENRENISWFLKRNFRYGYSEI